MRADVDLIRWRLVVATLLPVALLVGCSSTQASTRGSSPTSGVPVSGAAGAAAPAELGSVGPLLAADVAPSIPLALTPVGSSLAGSSIWYSDEDTGKVQRLDLVSGKAAPAILIGEPSTAPYGSPKEIAADTSGAWVADASRNSIDRIDDVTNRVTRRIALTTGTGDYRRTITPFGVELSGRTAWVTDYDQGLVAQVDTTTGRVTRVLDSVSNPEGMALGFGSLWVVQHLSASVARIDLTSWTVTAVVSLPGTGTSSGCGMCVGQVVAGPSALWVPLGSGKGVARIDPATNKVIESPPFATRVDGLAVDAAGVWVAGWDGSLPCTDTHAVLERLDPVTAAPTGRLVIPCALTPEVVGPSGDVWLATGDGPNGVTRIRAHA